MHPPPLLLLDVDGVLAPWGGEPPAGFAAHTFGAETDVYLAARHAVWLRKLAERMQIIWCTARCEEVTSTIAPALDLPDWPVMTFSTADLPAAPGPAAQTWKLPWVSHLAADRPLAWVDDELGDDAHQWAQQRDRRIPTALIQPSASVGLTDRHVSELYAFCDRASRYSERPSRTHPS